MTVSTKAVAVVTLKRAEDGDGVVARFLECDGRQQSFVFTWKGKAHALAVGANQLFTVKMADDGMLSHVNLPEEIRHTAPPATC